MDTFRSTGSYEPDPNRDAYSVGPGKFRSTGSYEPDRADDEQILAFLVVSIHRLLRA